MNLDTVTVIATVPAILALVNLGKRLGIGGEVSLALAVLLGVLLNLADFYWSGQQWYAAAVQGLILGLGAAGLYDITDNDPAEVMTVNYPQDGRVDDDALVQGAPWPEDWPPKEPR